MDAMKRPFEDYLDQPDTAERMRLRVYEIPFALPEKRFKDFSDGGEITDLLEGEAECP